MRRPRGTGRIYRQKKQQHLVDQVLSKRRTLSRVNGDVRQTQGDACVESSIGLALVQMASSPFGYSVILGSLVLV